MELEEVEKLYLGLRAAGEIIDRVEIEDNSINCYKGEKLLQIVRNS